jgi:hypothetical protein
MCLDVLRGRNSGTFWVFGCKREKIGIVFWEMYLRIEKNGYTPTICDLQVSGIA